MKNSLALVGRVSRLLCRRCNLNCKLILPQPVATAQGVDKLKRNLQSVGGNG